MEQSQRVSSDHLGGDVREDAALVVDLPGRRQPRRRLRRRHHEDLGDLVAKEKFQFPIFSVCLRSDFGACQGDQLEVILQIKLKLFRVSNI